MAILGSHHIAMKTTNYAKMKAFYTETLGFGIAGVIEGSSICFIDIGGTTIELIGAEEGEHTKAACGLIHMAYEVDDVDTTYAELVAKGVEFYIEPKGMGDIRLAFFYDPDGNELELFKSQSLSWN